MIVPLLLAVLVVLLLGVLIRRMSDHPAPDADPQDTMNAAVELHAIRRRLDVAFVRSELRSSSAALRREIDADLLAADARESGGRRR
jgi:hypothetical protein